MRAVIARRCMALEALVRQALILRSPNSNAGERFWQQYRLRVEGKSAGVMYEIARNG
jgi:hypothetical protein